MTDAEKILKGLEEARAHARNPTTSKAKIYRFLPGTNRVGQWMPWHTWLVMMRGWRMR